MFRLLFVALLSGVSSGHGSGLLGAKECTYGPSYWCASISKASQCSAVQHCLSAQWAELDLPKDNDGVCDICKDIVLDARATLQSPDTEKQIEQIFDEGCALIPVAEVKQECVKVGSEYIPELLLVLASQLEPQEVCATAGLCSSHWVDRLLAQHNLTGWRHVKTPVSHNTCGDCKQYLVDLVDMVASHSRQELLDRLLLVCSELGSISDSCSALVSVNIDTIYDFITYELDPDNLCDMLGMCDAFTAIPNSAPLSERSCTVCERAMYKYSNNYSLDQYMSMLETVCNQTKDFATQCKALVDHFGPASFQHMRKSGFSANGACRALGMCPSETPANQLPLWSALATPEQQPLRPGQLTGADEAAALAVDVRVAGLSGVARGGEACMLCQFTLHFVQQQLENPDTMHSIEQAVHRACSHFPKNIREQCDDYVDAYGDQMIAILEQEIAPEAVCPMLGLCPPPKALLEGKREEEQTHTLQTDAPCVLCEFVMEKLKQTLEDPNNQRSVKAALEQVCSRMPHVVRDQCHTFVEENTIEIIKLIDAGIEPQQVCGQLGLCSARVRLPRPAIHVHRQRTDALGPIGAQHQLPIARMMLLTRPRVPAVAPNPSVVGGPNGVEYTQSQECVLCEFVLSTLEKMMLDDNTHIEANIEAALDQVCLLLPSHLVRDCTGFVAQYTRPIVAMLVQNVDPSMVCRTLTLCHPAVLPFEAKLNRVEERMAVDAEEGMAPVDEFIPPPNVPRRARRSAEFTEDECTVCKALNNNNNYEASEKVEGFCTSAHLDIGSVDAARCGEIEQKLKTDGSCTGQAEQDGVCPKPVGGHALGRNPCTWGPAHWCSGRTNAHSCGAGAVQHCKRVGSLSFP